MTKDGRLEEMDGGREHYPYRILAQGGAAEIVEKKSRFIATLSPAAEEAEAAAFIEAVKKKYWDARHNCTAFLLGERGELSRCSDDGEPSGTAGKPILRVLADAQITNAAVVVTRYFGGVLLGTGGLVRAYTKAAQEGLAASRTAWMRYKAELCVTADYQSAERIGRMLKSAGLSPAETEYTDVVRYRLAVPVEEEESLRRMLTEAAAGKVRIKKLSEKYFIDK